MYMYIYTHIISRTFIKISRVQMKLSFCKEHKILFEYVNMSLKLFPNRTHY